MNWYVIVLGLVALSSVAIAENSYLVIVPKLLKVGYDNQLSVFIAAASQPVQVKFELTVGQKRIQGTTTVTPGTTRNAILTLPMECPVGAGELTIVGTGGVSFEEKRDVIVYDNRYVVLVQTSASTYRPGDTMEVRVVVTDEELIPIENDEVLIEIYDANLKLVHEFRNVPIRSGLTETLKFPIFMHCNIGTWLVSATVVNTTSSVQVLVAEPVTPSFDLKAIFPRFLLRTDKTLRGVIEIDNDDNEPIFGRAVIAVGQMTEQDVQTMMKQHQQMQQQQMKQQEMKQSMQQQMPVNDEWRKWKSQQIEIAGRVEINYDLLSLFNVDVTKCLAVQVHIQVTELASGQERFIEHVIPIFTREVIYDIRPLEFEAGIKNEFEVICKRPDGKPAKMEDLIVTVTMMMGNEEGKVQEEKQVEIKDFYTRGRTDIGLFNIEIPENVIGLLMTITPLSEDGKVRGYRTHAVPLMPTPRRGTSGAKLSIELLPSTTTPVQTDVNKPVVSTQISTVGRTSNFYIQLIPSKPVEKMEPLPMSYVLLTNGRITLTGEFTCEPTKECRTKTQRSIKPEEQEPPTCVFNCTLPIKITRDMIPYSTLLVYTFQPTFGFHCAESYRFSVAGLLQNPLTLNATVVPYTSTRTTAQDEDMNSSEESSSEDVDLKSISISSRAQDKTRVQLSFTGTPGSTVGLNVIEYDGVIQGLPNEITKERLLQYLTTYEQVPIVGMPTMKTPGEQSDLHTRGIDLDEDKFSTTTMEMDIDSTTIDSKKRGLENDDNRNVKDETTEKVDKEKRGQTVKKHPKKVIPAYKPTKKLNTRAVLSEDEEEEHILRERMGMKIRYPLEKMVFGISSIRSSTPVEGDDVYTTPNLGRLYGDKQTQQSQLHYRRRAFKSSSQYDVSVDDNDYVIATSLPLSMKTLASLPKPPLGQSKQQQSQDDIEVGQQGETQEMRGQYPQYGTPIWYEKMNSKLNAISQEAFTFMQSGLSIVTDFPSLHVPVDMRRTNLTHLFTKYRQQSTLIDPVSFNHRDEARQLLEEYLVESDLSMVPPPIILEEQARIGYYRSICFNTSRIESQGTGKVVLPRTKPYSTWLATGFSLHSKSGLSVAQPIRLPTNPGLFILGSFPSQCQMGEHVLLTCGINNYLGKDLTNVVVRIRASADFDLIEQAQPERVASTNGKDYTITIPSLRTLGVETRNIILVPKRPGVVKILLEVESEFGGDYEVLTTYVRESGIERKQISARLFDLTSEKKTYGPIVEKISPSPFLRSVRISVSGTGLDRLVARHTLETSSLIGVDRAIIRLWRLLGLRCYLNETSQLETPLFNTTIGNISLAYQKLQFYADYNGSYSFISDQGEHQSSLYLTTLALGALMSPMMPVHDNVTINRTLTWVLSHQQPDGSFDDEGPCFHYRFCSGPYRRESLTALVLYSLTRTNVSHWMPEYVRHQLYNGEQSPMLRAQRYLESRLDAVKPCLLTTTLIELCLVKCRFVSEQLKQKIYQNVRSRQLTVVPEDGSKFLKYTSEKVTMDDQLLVNALTLSIYGTFGDFQTTSDMARWIVEQIETHPHYDTVLDAVFMTEAWICTDRLFRQRFGSEKFSVVVDVTADNGQKQQFKIDSTNMDITQKLRFTLPCNQITYTVSGVGMCGVCIRQIYVEKQQQQRQTDQPIPFQLTNEFLPMPWLNEITTRTCLTYTPTTQNRQSAKDDFNRTIVVEVQLPSGCRLNLRQIGFFLSRVPEAMYFTFNERANKINFILNVPSTVYGKPICLNWCLERLSFITQWAPIQVRAYDYLQPELELVRLVPLQFQPSLLGYSFVEAVHKARPTMEQVTQMQQQMQQRPPPQQPSRV
jgi:hypothetical protein